jgi:hypothetical protein
MDGSTAALARFACWLGMSGLVFGGLAGCQRLADDRNRSEAYRAAVAAIDQYSTASAAANDAHRAVLSAFAAANDSKNLPDYKRALRERVLPAMDAFVKRLQAMPTGTPELAAVHAKLTDGYRKARDAIAEFERGLASPSELQRFDTIRAGLQAAAQNYETALHAYYHRHGRQLAGARAPTDTTAAPAPATPSAP